METFNPKELGNCQSDKCEVAKMCGRCALASIVRSPDGILLADNPPRFGTWHWDSFDEMKEHLGADVDPVQHGYHQANEIIVPMVQYQNAYKGGVRRFTEGEAKLLYLSNIFHDAHEGHTGDISLPNKNLSTYEAELEINQKVVGRILGLHEKHPFM